MKFDILLEFKEYLNSNLSPNTARTYYAAIVKLFGSIQFNDLKQIETEWIKETAATKFRTRNEYSAVKNGLKWLAKYDSNLKLPSEQEFRAVSGKKRNYSKKPPKVIYLKPTQRKINQIQNDRLRYALRLAEISGLRVSELADLEAKDITLESGKIYVEVKKGKGGHGGRVECRPDKYLYDRLPDFLEAHEEGKIFYSESYMREYARKLGIEMHDLRRIFAIQTRNELKKEMPAEKANEIVQQQLRHSRFSTTKRYLFNRKLKFEYGSKENGEEKEKSISTNDMKEETAKNKEYVPITRLDRERYKCISPEIITDEVVLTKKQADHIKERRGQDFYEKYVPKVKDIIDDPDYIFKDDIPNTALIVKQFKDDDKYIHIVLRLAILSDSKKNKNSVITMIGMGQKKFRQQMNKCIREDKVVYKKG